LSLESGSPTDNLAPIATWEDTQVSLEAVAQTVERLRAKGDRTASRTSVVNLVIVADDSESAERTAAAMRRLGARHPGRTILIRREPEGPARLDAKVALYEATAEGHQIWWEEISLGVSGPAAENLDSVVIPLVLLHLPVACWFPSDLPQPDDPLARACHYLLVDSRFAAPLGAPPGKEKALRRLLELCGRHLVIDLSWKRLSPWRELLASFFDIPSLSPWAKQVTSAHVAAQPGPRSLLAGWLVSRLGLEAGQLSLEDALHASIELRSGGDKAVFCVRRSADLKSVEATASVEGRVVATQEVELVEHALTWSLAQALSRLGRDRFYEEALEAATRGLW
jgi:glucose-6-phosphate dehydrogenase assembly protein OpcA